MLHKKEWDNMPMHSYLTRTLLGAWLLNG